MKIAIFTDTYVPDVNGVAKTLHRLTEFLGENQLEYWVFAPKSTEETKFSPHVMSFYSMPFLLYPECRIAIPNILHVKDELLDFRPDIIHVATPFNMGLCGLHCAKKLNIPIVGSYHTDFNKYLEHYHLRFLTDVLWKYLQWFYRPLQKIFVPSLDTMERLENYHFMNLSLWPRRIDGELFHREYDRDVVRKTYNIEEKFIVLYVGRIAPEKDVMMLPEINEWLPKKLQEDVHWLVVGDGPLKDVLEKERPQNMTLTGFLEGGELTNLNAAADLFVFPSASETFGNVVLESLACATPVIGTNAGGVRYIILQGKTGLLCEEENAADFASAVEYLLVNEKLRRQMGEEGYRHGQAQSWDAIFRHLLAEYDYKVKQQTLRKQPFYITIAQNLMMYARL